MMNKNNSCWVVAVVLTVAALSWSVAQAASLEVRVARAPGLEPLGGVAVCVGTPANKTQFGAFVTPDTGVIRLADLPRSPLVLILSRDGYRGEERRLGPAGFDRVITVQMHSGGGGPQCRPPELVRPADAALRELHVSRFRLNRGASVTRRRLVTLDFEVSGEPTHYRASERPDFSDTDWQPFNPKPTFTLSPTQGRKTVYLQLRRYSERDGITLEKTTEVVKDSIVLSGS